MLNRIKKISFPLALIVMALMMIICYSVPSIRECKFRSEQFTTVLDASTMAFILGMLALLGVVITIHKTKIQGITVAQFLAMNHALPFFQLTILSILLVFGTCVDLIIPCQVYSVCLMSFSVLLFLVYWIDNGRILLQQEEYIKAVVVHTDKEMDKDIKNNRLGHQLVSRYFCDGLETDGINDTFMGLDDDLIIDICINYATNSFEKTHEIKEQSPEVYIRSSEILEEILKKPPEFWEADSTKKVQFLQQYLEFNLNVSEFAYKSERFSLMRNQWLVTDHWFVADKNQTFFPNNLVVILCKYIELCIDQKCFYALRPLARQVSSNMIQVWEDYSSFYFLISYFFYFLSSEDAEFKKNIQIFLNYSWMAGAKTFMSSFSEEFKIRFRVSHPSLRALYQFFSTDNKICLIRNFDGRNLHFSDIVLPFLFAQIENGQSIEADISFLKSINYEGDLLRFNQDGRVSQRCLEPFIEYLRYYGVVSHVSPFLDSDSKSIQSLIGFQSSLQSHVAEVIHQKNSGQDYQQQINAINQELRKYDILQRECDNTPYAEKKAFVFRRESIIPLLCFEKTQLICLLGMEIRRYLKEKVNNCQWINGNEEVLNQLKDKSFGYANGELEAKDFIDSEFAKEALKTVKIQKSSYSPLLPSGFYCEGPLCFHVEIANVIVEDCSENWIVEKLTSCRKPYGLYFYEGNLHKEETLRKILNDEFCVVTICYSLELDFDSAYVFELSE